MTSWCLLTKSFILVGEIKAVEQVDFNAEVAIFIAAEAAAEADSDAADVALAAASPLTTVAAAEAAANTEAGELDAAALALSALTESASEAIAAAQADLDDAQAIVDELQAIVDAGVAPAAENAILLHSEEDDIIFNAQIDGSNTGQITIEAPLGEVLSAGGREYEATGFEPQIVAEDGDLIITTAGRIGEGDPTSIFLNGLSILTEVADVTGTSTNLNDVYLIELNDIVVSNDSSMGVLFLVSHSGTAEVNSETNADDKPVRITGNQIEILNVVQTSDNITVATTDLTLPIVIVPDLTLLGNVPESATGMILDQDEFNRLLTEATLFIGTEQLLNNLVLGDSGDTAFTFTAPNTTLRGDTIHVRSNIIANDIVFFGDGTTTTLSADIIDSDNVSFFDSIEVDGGRSVDSISRSPLVLPDSVSMVTVEATMTLP